MGKKKQAKDDTQLPKVLSSTSLDQVQSLGLGSHPPSIVDSEPHEDVRTPKSDSSSAMSVTSNESADGKDNLQTKNVVMVMPAVFDDLKRRVQSVEMQLTTLDEQVTLEVTKQLLNDVAPGAEKLANLDEKSQALDQLKAELLDENKKLQAKVQGLDQFAESMTKTVAVLITFGAYFALGQSNTSTFTKTLGFILCGSAGVATYDHLNSTRTQQKSTMLSLYETIFGKTTVDSNPSTVPKLRSI